MMLRALVAFCLSMVVGVCGADAIEGSWSGDLTFRQADWKIGLELSREGAEWRARIDLPEMLMEGELVPISQREDRLVIELPFGAGEFVLERRGDDLYADRVLGDEERMVLRLTRTAPAPFHTQEVAFDSGDAMLNGTLYLPDGIRRGPAVVLIHGSARGDRGAWEYRSWGPFFARRGIVALAYDRRGEGESTGSTVGDRHFQQLAADAEAAIGLLRRRPEVDPSRIGLSGASQGGWIAALVAASDPKLAWLLLRSSPAVTPADQEIQSVVYKMRRDAVSANDIQCAVGYMRLYFYVAASRRAWPELARQIEMNEGAAWMNYVDQPDRLEQLDWWGAHHDFDPAPLLSQIGHPVLALYGEQDPIVPYDRNEATLVRHLRAGGAEVTVQRLANADHRLELPMGGVVEGEWDWPRIAPQMFDVIDRWLQRVVLRSDHEENRDISDLRRPHLDSLR